MNPTQSAIPPVKKSSRIRKWSTPLIMGAFLLTALTGLGLFFEVKWGAVKPLHEWLSLTLVLGGVLHGIDHWKGMRNHWAGTWGKAFVIGAALIAGFAFLPLGGKQEHPSGRAMEESLSRIPLSTLAMTRSLSVDSLQARLVKAGFASVTPASTVEQLAGNDRAKRNKALNALMKDSKGEEEED